MSKIVTLRLDPEESKLLDDLKGILETQTATKTILKLCQTYKPLVDELERTKLELKKMEKELEEVTYQANTIVEAIDFFRTKKVER